MVRTNLAFLMILVAGLLVAGPLRGGDESLPEIVEPPASALRKQANALKEEQFEVIGQLVTSFPDSVATRPLRHLLAAFGMLPDALPGIS